MCVCVCVLLYVWVVHNCVNSFLLQQMQDLEGNFTKLNQTWWHELEEAISKVRM